ncbi:MAG: hypothetical protein ACE37F_11925 [Nannocystaceae bacterium]|nr:hypothetical protein [bacterium]
MSWRRSKVWRRIEDAMTGRLTARGRQALFEEVECNPAARADYDLAFEALRALEHAAVAHAELDVVEGWLMDDLAGEAKAPAWWRRPFVTGALAAGLALAAAVALVVAIDPVASTQIDDDGFAVRGAGDDRGLAIDVLCPREAGWASRRGLVPAAEYGCGLDGTLSFAYRLDPSVGGGTLSLFGVDEAGDVLYYAPTPASTGGVDAAPGTWTPLPMVVNLGVNHAAGSIVVYGLVSPQVPTIGQIDALAAALAEQGPGGIGDAPWHERLREHPALAAVCPPDTCHSAELDFTIHEATR